MCTSFKYLIALGIALLMSIGHANAEDGYRLWLRYDTIDDPAVLRTYRSALGGVFLEGSSPTLTVARDELQRGLRGLLDTSVPSRDRIDNMTDIVIGTTVSSRIRKAIGEEHLEALNNEGFVITNARVGSRDRIVIAGQSDIGVLYGVFAFLRHLQTHQPVSGINIMQNPGIQHRLLNHWDNLDRSVERGYAGLSLWDWSTLPNYKKPRYYDYARANASVGINGTVLNNVNADPRILTEQYIRKAAALAEVFRPYGIKVYFSVNFYAPIRIGGLETADPLDEDVQQWWKEKADEVYEAIPDFGGFLVKANSEGQPGPADYGRTHAEGANMLARALQPHDGILMWRAFVYSESQADRFREGYDEFVPLDGSFDDNVILQVKNGPIDFQPREPFHPLFGALPETNTMLELQITQEYFGFSNHLTYLGPLFEEALSADTYADGEGSTVAKVIDGDLFDYSMTAIAGVANTGSNQNWTGHEFGQANWYAFGRLAWDPTLDAEDIAQEWIRMTFSNKDEVVQPLTHLMMISREAGVNYRTPMGLAHLYTQGQHYGPAPWLSPSDMPRPDWSSAYYHRADSNGIGFDRTASGSDAVSQYYQPLQEQFRQLEQTPEEYLLWFHHVPWEYTLQSGRTVWEELVQKYYQGVEMVEEMQSTWASLQPYIDEERFAHVKALLEIQHEDAVWWRNACVLYFQTFSEKPIPSQYEKPAHDLSYYKELAETKHYARF